jgi:anthranilate synthase/aminodeoxychorismate synthase-like glutamine amidotransferase
MSAPHILIIDNYDSFVHNLARYVRRAGADTTILRNDAKTVKQIAKLKPDGIIISPGPKKPSDAGICIELIKTLGPTSPILGVCLGHQAIGEAYGGETIKAQEPVHGQSANITHNADGLFAGLPSPMQVGRYHSLITDIKNAPGITVTAHYNNAPMAIKHAHHPIYGVQFHPESILTEYGQDLIKNFINIVLDYPS